MLTRASLALIVTLSAVAGAPMASASTTHASGPVKSAAPTDVAVEGSAGDVIARASTAVVVATTEIGKTKFDENYDRSKLQRAELYLSAATTTLTIANRFNASKPRYAEGFARLSLAFANESARLARAARTNETSSVDPSPAIDRANRSIVSARRAIASANGSVDSSYRLWKAEKVLDDAERHLARARRVADDRPGTAKRLARRAETLAQRAETLTEKDDSRPHSSSLLVG